MIVLPDDSLPRDTTLASALVGTDGNFYSRTKVIQFARRMMVSMGVLLVLLPWIVPLVKQVQAMWRSKADNAWSQLMFPE